jgi:hypothetical protein
MSRNCNFTCEAIAGEMKLAGTVDIKRWPIGRHLSTASARSAKPRSGCSPRSKGCCHEAEARCRPRLCLPARQNHQAHALLGRRARAVVRRSQAGLQREDAGRRPPRSFQGCVTQPGITGGYQATLWVPFLHLAFAGAKRKDIETGARRSTSCAIASPTMRDLRARPQPRLRRPPRTRRASPPTPRVVDRQPEPRGGHASGAADDGNRLTLRSASTSRDAACDGADHDRRRHRDRGREGCAERSGGRGRLRWERGGVDGRVYRGVATR